MDKVGAKSRKNRWKIIAKCLQMPTANANKALNPKC